MRRLLTVLFLTTAIGCGRTKVEAENKQPIINLDNERLQIVSERELTTGGYKLYIILDTKTNKEFLIYRAPSSMVEIR